MARHSLRVGLLGSDAALADALAAIAAAVPLADAPPLLRLLHPQGAAVPVPHGWVACPLAGADAADVIVHNTDLLLVAGDPAAGMAEPVAAALALGVPVLWLTAPVRLLTDPFWRVARRPAPGGEDAWSALRQRLAKMLEPPPGPPPPALARIEADRRLPDRLFWRAHRAALALLARGPAAAAQAEPALAGWAALYAPADALAGAYADRYRSSYTLVLALAALALLAGVFGLRSGWHWPVAITEALCLAAIVALVWANLRLDWRSRMIQCRLLAELCRKQAALACVGRSLPAARIAGMTQGGGLDWIGWRFAAAVRAAPTPAGALSGESLAAARDAAAAVLLHGQRAYHAARVALGRRREVLLVLAGEAVFGATALFVLVKLALLAAGFSDTAEDAGLVAALLPAIAAALFGFRAYAELELLVQHSERLVGVLEAAERSLAGIDIEAAGAGRAIGDLLQATATEMLADIAGWIQIARVKAVEAG